MPTPAASTRAGVVLVEPAPVIRAGLRLLLTSDQGIRILGEARDADEALEQIERIRGGMRVVVLIGLELDGDHDALWLTRTVRREFPSMIVVVTGTDLDTVPISKALFVGADGFIHRGVSQERIVGAVRRASEGEIVLEGLPRGALGGIVEGFGSGHTSSALTDREREVIIAASRGLTARQIARRLGVAERTVTTHLNHIYRKLGASGRISALTSAAKLGLLDGSWRPDEPEARVVTIA